MSVFGEIELGMSRAVSDDEDDEFAIKQEDENLKRKIYWLNNNETDQKVVADQLILADGASSSAFIYTYLLSHYNHTNGMTILGLNATQSEYKVFQVNHETVEQQQMSTPTFRSNFIYLIKNLNGKNIVICQLFDQLKPNELYDWIRQLTNKVEFTSTLLFCSQNKTTYLGNSAYSVPFVKLLSSDKQYAPECTRLESPNFVANLSAAIIHYCMEKNIQFLTFVCYNAYIAADIQSVKEIFKATNQRLKEKNLFIDNEMTKKTLMSLNSIVTSGTSIYM